MVLCRCCSAADCSTCTDKVGSLAERNVNGPRSAAATWCSNRLSTIDDDAPADAVGVVAADEDRLSSLYCAVAINDAGILSVDPPSALE